MNTEQKIIHAIIQALLSCGLEKEQLPDLKLGMPKQKEHGDLSSNAAMIAASILKTNPKKIAQSIKEYLAPLDLPVTKIEIAGPGFINFTLKQDEFLDGLKNLLHKSSAFGKIQQENAPKTQVEFVSANPTGPLTIGHGRQAVIGDTIARLLAAAGHHVTREYYFNDAGRQMRVLADSVRQRYLELLGLPSTLGEDHYQGLYIKDIARLVYDAKGDSLAESDDLEFFKSIAENHIFNEIKQTLARLNIHFDLFFNEKSLYESGKIQEVITVLKEQNLAYEKDGALWFKTSVLGQDQDRVIIKSTGEPTYRLPDIAYHCDKMERNFDCIVDIFGADHVATYPDVLAGLEAMGYDQSKVKVLIHQFVTLMEGKEKVKMSTRKANFVTLDELIDEVGEDVTRYFFINRSMNSHLNFDLTLAKTRSDENPVYYVQYAHARICSIIRHAESEGYYETEDYDLSLLTLPEEQNLIKWLLTFPDIVCSAARDFEPQRIPAYLEETANLYHKFQHAGKMNHNMRVVTENRKMSQARLALCRAAKIVLANGLELLGISRPERM